MKVKFYKNEDFNGGIHWNTFESKFFIEEKELSEKQIKSLIKGYTNEEYEVNIKLYRPHFNIGDDKFILVYTK